jgi:hypothetical protein
MRYIEKIRSLHANLLHVTLRDYVHIISSLLGKHTYLSVGKYTLHHGLVIFFHMPKMYKDSF